MTASFSQSAPRLPGTAIAWATKDALFVEIPSASGGPPFIVRYRRSIEGLSLALNVLIDHMEPTPRQIPAAPPTAKVTPTSTAKPRAPWATDEQRQRARELIKRLIK